MEKHLINGIGILRSLRHCVYIGRCILPKKSEFDINCILFKYEKGKIK